MLGRLAIRGPKFRICPRSGIVIVQRWASVSTACIIRRGRSIHSLLKWRIDALSTRRSNAVLCLLVSSARFNLLNLLARVINIIKRHPKSQQLQYKNPNSWSDNVQELAIVNFENIESLLEPIRLAPRRRYWCQRPSLGNRTTYVNQRIPANVDIIGGCPTLVEDLP